MEGTSANTLIDVADVDSSNEAVMVHTLLLHGSEKITVILILATYVWFSTPMKLYLGCEFIKEFWL